MFTVPKQRVENFENWKLEKFKVISGKERTGEQVIFKAQAREPQTDPRGSAKGLVVWR